jgi:uncharacterized protein (DUF169 family)
MTESTLKKDSEFIKNNLRLKTSPVAIKFLAAGDAFPEKTRRPFSALGKRIAICQAVTMARNYGWTVGMTKEDNICVPAAIVFGFSDSQDPSASLSRLFTEINFSKNEACAIRETASMSRFEKGEIAGIVAAPCERAVFDPDVVVIYGNPAQMMRLSQAWSYMTGERLSGHFGGKVECDQYLIAPHKTQKPQIVIPGNGERIFAMTQDDEMVFAMPARFIPDLIQGLNEAGKAVGSRYPVPPFQFFQPDFPKAHKDMGKEIGVLR